MDDNNNKFQIKGRNTFDSIFFLSSGGTMCLILLTLKYEVTFNYGFLENLFMILITLLLIALCLSFFCIGIYFGIFEKTLQIDDHGIQYLINKKIKKEIPWEDLKKVTVELSSNGNSFYLNIYGSKEYIYFDNGKTSASLKDLITAFNKILEYQPKYKFIVKDEAGWKI